jgi:hypothetical protein
VNGPADELYASASARGDLYFAVGARGPHPRRRLEHPPGGALGTRLRAAPADRGGQHRPPFDPRDPTADWEFNPEVSADGRTLVFTSLRPAATASATCT